jgi:hypothetical protein
MPIHDWTCVDAGVFHAFYHGWIEELARALNRGILPSSYYALPEQHAAGFGPDVLTLQDHAEADLQPDIDSSAPATGGVLLAPPTLQPVAETDLAFYRRKQKTVTVRHVSGDRIVAIVEIISPGNKNARHPFRSLVTKAAELLDHQIHLLMIDLFPRGTRDPQGIHHAIWQEIAGEADVAPSDKPFTLVSYASGVTVRAYVVGVGLGEELTDMPLFLEPEQAVDVPLEQTYTAAFAETPRRWRRVLEQAPL